MGELIEREARRPVSIDLYNEAIDEIARLKTRVKNLRTLYIQKEKIH